MVNLHSIKRFLNTPKAKSAIIGGAMMVLPHVRLLKPLLGGQLGATVNLVGMGLTIFSGIQLLFNMAHSHAADLVDKKNAGELNNLIKTQQKWTPIAISELSESNLEKINLEKPILSDDTQEKVNAELDKIGNWNNPLGMNGISQTYQSVLLYGPTGSGKSSVARQMIANFDKKAKQGRRTHYHIKIEPTMLSSEYGNAKLGKLLDDIKSKINTQGEDKVAFSILMDECDGALKKGNETANQYNTMIDAFTKEVKAPMLQILTTNHMNAIDPRTIRLGRCDTKIEIPNPDRQTKQEIIRQTIDSITYNGRTIGQVFQSITTPVKAAFKVLGNQAIRDRLDKAQEAMSTIASQSLEPVFDRLANLTVRCRPYNVATGKRRVTETSLNRLLDDETISGSTTAEIAQHFLKSLTVKARQKDNQDPFRQIVNDVGSGNTDEFIRAYDLKSVISEAIEQALTQKSLEEKK